MTARESYQREMQDVVLHLREELEALQEQLRGLECAARSYRTLVLPYLDSPEEVGAAEELDYYLSRGSNPASRPDP